VPVKVKQPKCLKYLFLSELWERFGFYILQGLLVLYLSHAMGLSDSKSFNIFGAFLALVYITPVLGGYIADKIIGFRYAVISGGLFLSLGYSLLGFAGVHFLYLSLGIVCFGNGLFKPNVSSLLGTVYEADDVRRDSGFTWFYMGINIGVMLATVSAGWIQLALGWSACFYAAGLGLIIGVITFITGWSHLHQHGAVPKRNPAHRVTNYLAHPFALFLLASTTVAICAVLIYASQLASILILIFAVLVFLGLLVYARRTDKNSAQRIYALIVLLIASILFWAFFFQIFSSGILYIQRDINRQAFGFTLPTILFISLESIFILILSPMLAKLWLRLYKNNNNISIPHKFALGLLFLALCFAVFALSTKFHDQQHLVNPLWVVLAFLLLTIGEMLLSPIGLSAMTQLAPSNLSGFIMGIWFFSTGVGGDLSGPLAKIASIPPAMTNKTQESHLYGAAFLQYALMSLLAAVIMFMIAPKLQKVIANVVDLHS